LGVYGASVARHRQVIAQWLEHNVPRKELRVSLRANGYGLWFLPSYSRSRPPVSSAAVR